MTEAEKKKKTWRELESLVSLVSVKIMTEQNKSTSPKYHPFLTVVYINSVLN